MARFFIDRPIFAWVISILIVLIGALAVSQMSIAQYPTVAPPAISVTANYAGASAETLQNTVTSVIEQQLNGIDNLLYLSSSSESSGQSTTTLYFQPGTNPDTAQVQVQNKVQLATPSLPAVVQLAGVTVAKATRNYIMVVTLSSSDGSLDEIALGNYLASKLLDPVRRVSGVGDVIQFGTENAMRIWLNPQKLNSYNLTPGDVNNAIAAQNTQVPVGQLGARPAVVGQQINVVLQSRVNLETVAQFQKIILRVNPDGSRVSLGDVARVELGGQDYNIQARVNGQPATAMAIRLAPGANALSTVEGVRKKINELSAFFPPGVKVDYPLDTSTFVKISIEEVVKTLAEAIILVFLVMYLFLQNIRTTLIPTIVVPIALLGAFAAMFAFGFSINVLTMFGVVLAIGILVDDAIVVVEAVERIMSEEGLSPRDATIKAMDQITPALIGITSVLVAVFVPMAFFGGSVGAIYRQFSLALVSSMLFSVFLALSLTPALCASFLKAIPKGGEHKTRGLFGWFNRNFDAATNKYQRLVKRILGRTAFFILLYLGIVAVVVLLYLRLPSSFLPEEDQGYFYTIVQIPSGGTQERTLEAVKQMEAYYLKQPEIETLLSVTGFSFNGRGQNSGFAFVRLKDWKERGAGDHAVQAVIKRAFGAFSQIRDALVIPINPPAISELGNGSGFDFQLQDLGNLGHVKLLAARDQLLGLAAKDPHIVGARVQGLEDSAQLKIITDEAKAAALGVSLGDINTTMATGFGSTYVNNFVNGTRIQRVITQLDAPFRMTMDDIGKIFVRNSSGTMVPMSSLVNLQWGFNPPKLEKFNGFPSVNILGSAPPGGSTGEAMDAMEALTKKLPKGIGFAWNGQSYEERLSGSQAPLLYAASLIIVFLCLAALYESWAIPLSVILVVPLGILGAILGVTLRGLPNDVYFKVGLLTTVGLATKNAILIIEYAKDLQADGMGLIEAMLEAVHLRLRPILMTSLAFILGVLPLVISTGAGSASQNAIGTGVAAGVFAATFLGIFLIPVFYVVIARLFKFQPKRLGSHAAIAAHNANNLQSAQGETPDASAETPVRPGKPNTKKKISHG